MGFFVFKIMRYVGYGFLALVSVLLILPYFISLDSYKAQIKSEVKQATGREITINGPMKFRILPRPYVQIQDIALSSIAGATEPVMAKIEAIEVNVAFLTLLRGRIDVASVELNQPEITLEKLENGKANWDFDLPASAQTTDIQATPQAKASTASPALPFMVHHIIIQKGTLRYVTAGQKTELNDVDLKLDAQSLIGPFQFDLGVKVFGEPVKVNGTVATLGEQIPIEMELKAFGEKLKVKGQLAKDPFAYRGQIKMAGNLQNLQKVFGPLDLPEGLKKDYKIQAETLINAQKIALHPIDITLADLKGQGSIVYNLKNNISKVDLKLNPGEITVHLSPQPSGQHTFAGLIKVKAENIEALLRALQLKTTNLPKFLLSDLLFATHLTYSDQNLNIKNITFDVGKAKLTGDVGIKNWHKNVTAHYDLRTANAAALAKVFDIDLPTNTGPAKVVGESALHQNILTTNTSLFALNAKLQAAGSINVEKKDHLRPALDLTASGSSLHSTLHHLGTEASKALGKFSLQAAITGEIPQAIKVKLGTSSFTIGRTPIGLSGESELKLGGVKPRLTVDLSLSALNLDTLMTALAGKAAPAHQLRLASTQAGPSKIGSQSPWSNEKIDLTFLRSFDGDITLRLPSIRKGSLVFDSLNFKARIVNGIMDINTLTGNLYGGTLSAKGRLSSQNDQPVTLTATLKEAQLKNIPQGEGQIKVIKGSFSLTTDLNSRGHSEYQYVNNLDGSLTFNANEGQISGFDLQKIIKQLTNVRDLMSAMKLLDSSMSGGTTAFHKMEGNVAIQKGTAVIKQCLLDAVGANATATGKVNLPKYWMDLESLIHLEGIKDLPPFKVRFYGPLDNPKRDLKTEALQRYLIDNVLGNIVKNLKSGRPEDIIKGIIGLSGKKGTQQPAPQARQPEQQPSQPQQPGQQQPAQQQPAKEQKAQSPEKVIGNILKGLF
jgi:uncharacterized protein involved in outer membrane biogenesis